jgi:hypothetical protein
LKELFNEIERDKIKLNRVIILGDLKHRFNTISSDEWRDTKKLIEFILKKINKIVLIRGNHDILLEHLTNKSAIEIKEFYRYQKYGFLHGNKLNKEIENKIHKVKVLFVGHYHPAILLKDKYKQEKYKCFLKGVWKKKKIYVLPCFNPEVFGKIKKNEFGFIQFSSLRGFDCLIYDEKERKTYNFGKLKEHFD